MYARPPLHQGLVNCCAVAVFWVPRLLGERQLLFMARQLMGPQPPPVVSPNLVKGSRHRITDCVSPGAPGDALMATQVLSDVAQGYAKGEVLPRGRFPVC